jgi:acetoin utilization deacetylase AcuC-like enzyme
MRSNLWNSTNLQSVQSAKARVKDVELVHASEYVSQIRRLCESGGGLLDQSDTVASPRTYDVALHAVGGTLRAARLVIEGKFRNAFALVRPPGHHATKLCARGFCIFNNVSIAASYLLKNFNLQRILILDIDSHHGNGTQETFYDTDKVLFISLHEDPSEFPGTGFTDEIGEGKGLGYKINIPLPFKTADEIYLQAMDEVVSPIVRQYRPQFMFVSAGFDGHYTDPVGNLSLSGFCYEELFERIVNLARDICQGRLVSVLEGGYSLGFVGKLAALALAKMGSTPYVFADKISFSKKHVRSEGRRIIEEVKKIQSSFWRI